MDRWHAGRAFEKERKRWDFDFNKKKKKKKKKKGKLTTSTVGIATTCEENVTTATTNVTTATTTKNVELENAPTIIAKSSFINHTGSSIKLHKDCEEWRRIWKRDGATDMETFSALFIERFDKNRA